MSIAILGTQRNGKKGQEAALLRDVAIKYWRNISGYSIPHMEEIPQLLPTHSHHFASLAETLMTVFADDLKPKYNNNIAYMIILWMLIREDNPFRLSKFFVNALGLRPMCLMVIAIMAQGYVTPEQINIFRGNLTKHAYDNLHAQIKWEKDHYGQEAREYAWKSIGNLLQMIRHTSKGNIDSVNAHGIQFHNNYLLASVSSARYAVRLDREFVNNLSQNTRQSAKEATKQQIAHWSGIHDTQIANFLQSSTLDLLNMEKSS